MKLMTYSYHREYGLTTSELNEILSIRNCRISVVNISGEGREATASQKLFRTSRKTALMVK